MAQRKLLFEGFTEDELLGLPSETLEGLILTGEPLVFRAGSATILGSFRVRKDSLVVELAQIDCGGEGSVDIDRVRCPALCEVTGAGGNRVDRARDFMCQAESKTPKDAGEAWLRDRRGCWLRLGISSHRPREILNDPQAAIACARRRTVSTVMSSSWPKPLAASAI